jgi:hypothetical protein
MESRGYKCDFSRFEKWIDKPWALETPEREKLFKDWHNDRYLLQCYYNLQEKHDCGGISDDEWLRLHNRVSRLLKL